MDATLDAGGSDGSLPVIQDGGAVDGPAPDRSEPADAAEDATISDSPSTDGPPSDARTGDSEGTDDGPNGSSDATMDAAGTFACGPTKRCDAATEYCSVVGVSVVNDIILPLDGARSGSSYSCVDLPACEASDPCTCFPSVGPVPLSNVIIDPVCSCSDDGGDVTRTCTN